VHLHCALVGRKGMVQLSLVRMCGFYATFLTNDVVCRDDCPLYLSAAKALVIELPRSSVILSASEESPGPSRKTPHLTHKPSITNQLACKANPYIVGTALAAVLGDGQLGWAVLGDGQLGWAVLGDGQGMLPSN